MTFSCWRSQLSVNGQGLMSNEADQVTDLGRVGLCGAVPEATDAIATRSPLISAGSGMSCQEPSPPDVKVELPAVPGRRTMGHVTDCLSA